MGSRALQLFYIIYSKLNLNIIPWFDYEFFKSLDYTDNRMPIQLNTITQDLSEINKIANKSNSKFILSSFVWLPYEELKLSPKDDYMIIKYLSKMFPFNYSDIENMNKFQNYVYSNFAIDNELQYVDLNKIYPKNPALFIDGIHNTIPGLKLRAWYVFNNILPILNVDINNGYISKNSYKEENSVNFYKEKINKIFLEDVIPNFQY